MPGYQLIQVGYVLLNGVAAAVLLFTMLYVMNWPQVNGRSLLLSGLALRLLACAGHTVIGLLQLLQLVGFSSSASAFPITSILNLLLGALGVGGDGLILVALLTLGGVFQAIRRGNQEAFPPR